MKVYKIKSHGPDCMHNGRILVLNSRTQIVIDGHDSIELSPEEAALAFLMGKIYTSNNKDWILWKPS